MKAPAEGTLRAIATFLAAFGIGVATYIAIADSGRRLAGLPRRRPRLRRPSPTAPTRTWLGVNIAVFGIAGYVLLLACALLRGDAARMAGFGVALVGFGYSVYLTYLELFKIDAICQWCVASAVLMTILFCLNAIAHGRLRRDRAMSGSAIARHAAKSGCAKSEARRGAPPAPAPARQRRRLPGDRRGGGPDRGQPAARRSGGDTQPRGRRPRSTGELAGIPQNGHGARRPEREGEADRVRRPPVPGLQSASPKKSCRR